MFPSMRRSRRRARPGAAPAQGSSTFSVVPYDHAASFELTGRPGNVLHDVINVSSEGNFVATAIGYGFEEDRGRSLSVETRPQDGLLGEVVLPGDITLGELPLLAVIEGFRINPALETVVFSDRGAGSPGGRARPTGDRVLSDQPVAVGLVRAAEGREEEADLLIQSVKAPEDISFLFNIADGNSGRELQDEPILNLASLGKSNGERPFRLLAQPVTFLPRSTIRLQVIERSEGVKGTLFIVLYGYRILAPACPEPVIRTLRGSPACPTETIGNPSAHIIPFDYVATLDLTGRPRNRVDEEIVVSADGGFVATSLGYGLAIEERDVRIEWERLAEIRSNSVRKTIQDCKEEVAKWKADPALPRADPPLVDLAAIPFRLLPVSALMDGVRIRPSLLRLALDDSQSLASVPSTLVDEVFERLNRPEDVSFRYMISDSGRGIDLQNEAIHNVAGLGIANGDRPFKRFARPLTVLPRSTIRVSVEERFGRGRLFVVFQGYKILGRGPARGRA